MTIEVLDPEETASALQVPVHQNDTLTELTEALMPLLDTGYSVYKVGLTERTLNMLRTKLLRRGVSLSARKVKRGTGVGHVLRATTKVAVK